MATRHEILSLINKMDGYNCLFEGIGLSERQRIDRFMLCIPELRFLKREVEKHVRTVDVETAKDSFLLPAWVMRAISRRKAKVIFVHTGEGPYKIAGDAHTILALLYLEKVEAGKEVTDEVMESMTVRIGDEHDRA